MRTIIFSVIFFALVALLFFSLFNQPISKDTREIRSQMRTALLSQKHEEYKMRFVKRCIGKMYEEAEVHVDSLIASPSLNPVNELDSLKRPFRPDAKFDKEKDIRRVALEPLFDKVDSTRLDGDQ
jgi:hypothetical protein